MLEVLNRRKKVVLASASPRRAEILRKLGLRFRAVSADVDEQRRAGESPASFARRLAVDKALAARGRGDGDAWYIGADTIVVLGRQVLGKPGSRREAARMLRLLSGRTHRVITGVAIVDGGTGRALAAADVTVVKFRRLTESEIERYVRTGEPMDKAGAYGIQEGAAAFVERIEGNYLNVVGFPVGLFLRLAAICARRRAGSRQLARPARRRLPARLR
ncbi:MAG: nucleoside triphosphate pyrophosphatase [Acidobacteriota bacterium]